MSSQIILYSSLVITFLAITIQLIRMFENRDSAINLLKIEISSQKIISQNLAKDNLSVRRDEIDAISKLMESGDNRIEELEESIKETKLKAQYKIEFLELSEISNIMSIMLMKDKTKESKDLQVKLKVFLSTSVITGPIIQKVIKERESR